MSMEEEMAAIDLEQQRSIATMLHALQCSYNHTDGCGWFYAEDNWGEYSHVKFMAEANRVIRNVGSATMVEIVLKGMV
jgi:hypothetical protein